METRIFCKNIFHQISKLFLFFIIANFFLTLTLFSQVREKWVARYNGPGNNDDTASELAVDDSGNVYVTGGVYGLENDFDYVTIKYDSEGLEQWVAIYQGPAYDDIPSGIVIDNSGNIYVTGFSRASGTDFDADYTTIKYNSNGVQQWIERYSGSGNEWDNPNAIAIDSSGNVHVTGKGYYDYLTIKYSSTGVEQWAVRYYGPGHYYPIYHFDEATSLALDNYGNVYVTGYSYGLGTLTDYATVKYNSNGVEEWVARYNGPGNGDDRARDISVDNWGNIFVTGYSESSPGNYACTTIKYNNDGIEQWIIRDDTLGINIYNYGECMRINSSGDIFIAGKRNGKTCVVKYNNDGVQIWSSIYIQSFSVEALCLDSSSNIYITGTPMNDLNDCDYITVKYNNNGGIEWHIEYNGPASGKDIPHDIAVDSEENVYVTGESRGSESYTDFATIKYIQNVAVNRKVWMNY